MDSSKPTITHATRDDVPEILAMILELAAYEDATDKVHATKESLLNTLSFAEHPGGAPTTPGYAKTLLLRVPVPGTPNHGSANGSGSSAQAVAGMALYFNNYSTWTSAPGIYLEDLFIRPAYRKHGYGKLLIQSLAKECKRIGGGRVEWCCLRWNEKALGFYRGLGAEEMSGWVTLRLDGDELEVMARGVEGGDEKK